MMLFRSSRLATAARSIVTRSQSTSASTSSTPAPSTSSASLPSTTSAASSSNRNPDFFKVTLMRSAIGLRPEVRKTVASLGFKKRMQTIYSPIDEPAVGKILRIKELVKVEIVSRETMELETAPKDRRANAGYSVIGKAFS